MREILFRARTISEDEYMEGGEWIEGFYTCFNGDEHRIYTGYSETDCGDHYPDWFTVLPETVGQYTGLTDKNGKRIFEGDIIECVVIYDIGQYPTFEKEIHAVCYREGCFTPFYNCERNSFEVIGNIHDNPELLKGGE